NMLQSEIARALAARKAANIERIKPDVIATSNLGCMVQIGQATAIPVVHLVELIDWAAGGPTPQALQNLPHESPIANTHTPAAGESDSEHERAGRVKIVRQAAGRVLLCARLVHSDGEATWRTIMAKSKRKRSKGAAGTLKKMKRAATSAMKRAKVALGAKKKRKSSAKKRAGARKAATRKTAARRP